MLFLHVAIPFITAFVVAGIVSLTRFFVALRAGGAVSHPASWSSDAIWGSTGWRKA